MLPLFYQDPLQSTKAGVLITTSQLTLFYNLSTQLLPLESNFMERKMKIMDEKEI